MEFVVLTIAAMVFIVAPLVGAVLVIADLVARFRNLRARQALTRAIRKESHR